MNRPTAHASALGAGLFLAAIIAVLPRPGLPSPVALAQGVNDTTQRELRIERSLACPQCTDLQLDVCDQDICNDMRAIIHQKVTAGESDTAIRQYFVQRYGSRVLLAPPRENFGFLVWALPFVALASGAALTVAYLRSARANAPEATAVAGASNDTTESADYRSRVEREVGELE
jgi:cytochrome c-type biogenesis protein CcmH